MSHTLYIYLWNPKAVAFRKLSFDSKLYELERVVKRNLEHYKRRRGHDKSSLCLLIAPDYLFEAPQGKEYNQNHKSIYDMTLTGMRTLLDEDVLLFGGSIRWINYQTSALMVTALVVSHRGVELEYHKRFKANTEDDVDTVFDDRKQGKLNIHAKFKEGDVAGRFSFQKLKFGLEICQDHEMSTLLSSNQRVDVHVLLSYGQSARPDRVATRPDGLFIQCELMPGVHEVQLDSITVPKTIKSFVAHVESKLFAPIGVNSRYGEIKNTLHEVSPAPIDNISIETSRCQLFVVEHFG